jgi:hypothetical protein
MIASSHRTRIDSPARSDSEHRAVLSYTKHSCPAATFDETQQSERIAESVVRQWRDICTSTSLARWLGVAVSRDTRNNHFVDHLLPNGRNIR